MDNEKKGFDKKFERGDWCSYPMWLLNDRYDHHFIYLGNDQAIGYTRSGVEIDTMTGSGDYQKSVRVKRPPSDQVEKIIKRAMSRIGEDKYQLLKHNCEHFVAWAFGAKNHCNQATHWDNALTTAGQGMLATDNATWRWLNNS